MDFSDLLTGNDVPQKARFSNSEWKRMFGNRIPAEVSVFRDGVRRGVFGEHIVTGALFELDTSDIFPAVVRLLWSGRMLT